MRDDGLEGTGMRRASQWQRPDGIPGGKGGWFPGIRIQAFGSVCQGSQCSSGWLSMVRRWPSLSTYSPGYRDSRSKES